MSKTFTIFNENLNKDQARRLAADLLAWAGPERPAEFKLEYEGSTLTLERSVGCHEDVIAWTNGEGIFRMKPPQIKALIEWLQGHLDET